MQENTVTTKLVVRMQKLVDSFSIPLKVVWRPDPKAKCHGEIANRRIIIYNVDEEEVWDTLTHELIEYKLKKVSNVYRETVNALIEVIQKVAYTEKESFIATIPILIDAVQKAKAPYTNIEDRK